MNTAALGKYGPIDVFRAGSFTAADGSRNTFTESDLHQIASSYDRNAHPAPVVIGHPETDHPAYGWVERMFVENGTLKATLEDTVPEFAETVRAGRYRKVSVALFLPGSTNNPTPGNIYLKHVGFLGAAAPAVTGLKPVRFTHDATGSLVLTQDNPRFAQFAERDELTRLRRQVREQEVENLINEGRVLPVFKEEVVAFAASLDDRETVSFAEGKPAATRKDWFLSYLARQPKVVHFGEMDLGPDPFGQAPAGHRGVNIPDGYQADRSNDALLTSARRIVRDKGVSFSEALDIAMQEAR